MTTPTPTTQHSGPYRRTPGAIQPPRRVLVLAFKGMSGRAVGLAFRTAGDVLGDVLVHQGADILSHANFTPHSVFPLFFSQVDRHPNFVLKRGPATFISHDYMIAYIDALSILRYHLFCLGMVASSNATQYKSIPPATATPQPAASLDKSIWLRRFAF